MNENPSLSLNEQLSTPGVVVYTSLETVTIGGNVLSKFTDLRVLVETGNIEVFVGLTNPSSGREEAKYSISVDPRVAINMPVEDLEKLNGFDYLITGDIYIYPKGKDYMWTDADLHPWTSLGLFNEWISEVSIITEKLIELGQIKKGKIVCCTINPTSISRRSPQRNDPKEKGRWTEIMIKRYNAQHKEEPFEKIPSSNLYVRYFQS